MNTIQRAILLSFMAMAVFFTGCSSLHFRKSSVLKAFKDEHQDATRVRLTFEVWDGDQQLMGLPKEAFTVFEDAQPATSESLSDAARDQIRMPVILVLDTSYSMYLANAIGDLKRAATKFKKTLTDKGFAVDVYRFANKIEPVGDIESIPEVFDEETGERFTSLYAAINQGFAAKSDAIIVAFSDGADNYSQNHKIGGLRQIETQVLPPKGGGTGSQRVVHAIAFGDFANERDRDGVPALQALRRIAINGSLSTAAQVGALDNVFQDVANRIRNVYIFEYLSPNLSGAHTLQIVVNVAGETARTAPMKYSPLAGEVSNALRWVELDREMRRLCKPGKDREACVAAGKRASASFQELCSKTGRVVVGVDGATSHVSLSAGMQAVCKRAPLYEEREVSFLIALMDNPAGVWAKVDKRAERTYAFSSVTDGGPAQKAGLKAGDVIEAIAGQDVADSELYQIVLMLRGNEGTEVTIRVNRQGESLTLKITRALLK